MKQTILGTIILIGIFAGGFFSGFTCKTSPERIPSDYEQCINGIKSSEHWSLFGDITAVRPDSASLAECNKIYAYELRQKLINKYCKTFDKDCKNKLQFAVDGLPKAVKW